MENKDFIVLTRLDSETWEIVDICTAPPVIFVLGEKISNVFLSKMEMFFGYKTFKVNAKIAKIAKIVYLKRKKK